MQEELRLLARARALDQDALTEIHDTYYGPIFRYVTLRVGDEETAADLTSEVFLRLLSALRDHTAPQNTLRGWLYGVASRVVSDHHRRQYRNPQVPLDETLAAAGLSVADSVHERLTWETVHQALTALTEDQQEVLALRFGYEMSIRDVAETIGKSEGAVKQLQARAVASLARIIARDQHG